MNSQRQGLSMLPADEQAQAIESALQHNLSTLWEALRDVLAALVLLVIGVASLGHAVLRVTFAVLSLLLWSVALLVVGLQGLRSWLVAGSGSSIHKGR